MADAQCPYCGEIIDIWVDEGGGAQQSYIEDCSVCCRPLRVHAERNDDGEYVAALDRTD